MTRWIYIAEQNAGDRSAGLLSQVPTLHYSGNLFRELLDGVGFSIQQNGDHWLPKLCDFADEFVLFPREFERIGITIGWRPSRHYLPDRLARDNLIPSERQYNHVGRSGHIHCFLNQ